MTEQTTQTQTQSEEATEAKTFDEAYVKQLRGESASYRVKLRESEEKLSTYESQLESQRESLLNRQVELAAKAAGAVDPQTITKLIDREALEKDELGFYQGVDEHIQQLVTDKPYLKQGSVGKSSNPVGGNGSAKIFTRQELDSMSTEEINANWEDIEEQMAKGLIR